MTPSSIRSTRRFAVVLLASASSMFAFGAASAAVTFDVIASSGATGGGTNQILRFDGLTGDFLGVFSSPLDGVNDPRDIIVDSRPNGIPNTFFVNTGNFPPSPTPDNDNVFVLDADGNVLRTAVDFSETGSGFVDAGGGVFGPNGNLFVGSRAQNNVLEFDPETGAFIGPAFAEGLIDGGIRGFVFNDEGTLFVGNGANLSTGLGGGGIFAVENGVATQLVDDPELSPLDVILDPTQEFLVVSSQFPFEDGNAAAATIRIFDVETGELVNVLDPGLGEDGEPLFASPRGLGFAPDGTLFASSTGTGSILRFDIGLGTFLGVFAEFEGLNGQALAFIDTTPDASEVPLPGAGLLMAAGGGFLVLRRRKPA
ncbi:hypothetical protein [Parvularcula maris]|uniref:PEP-CTERM sorting domain-containing protein n=1 Tax=Parvularcula maris TaxID=2965077 RepID=A0A9X2LAI1_9PROT|nr:hypothetical protein [Parvularcula maris]MCQ8186155.1 hypothetical protein [Parvularcula maris]